MFLPSKGEYALPPLMVCDRGANVSHDSLVSLAQAGLSVNTLAFLFQMVLLSHRNEGQNVGEVLWSAV